jgi:RNA polymerase sigma-70 factor, ECF subfamily
MMWISIFMNRQAGNHRSPVPPAMGLVSIWSSREMVSNAADDILIDDEQIVLDRLVARAQAGDLRAFDELVLEYQQQIFAMAYRMLGNQDEAQEIAQDTFVRAFRALDTFRREAKFSTWLMSITMNLCRNRRRWWARRKRVISTSLDAPTATGTPYEVADTAPTPAVRAQQHELQGQILAALQRVSADFRAVIVLRDVDGHSYAEIAEMLGCQIGTVKSRMSRARRALRDELDGAI